MTEEKSKTPFIDYLLDRYQGLVLPRDYHVTSDDQDNFRWKLEALELAANKLHSRLSIWVNTASVSTAGYVNMKDLKVLADFELLRKL